MLLNFPLNKQLSKVNKFMVVVKLKDDLPFEMPPRKTEELEEELE
jgi:hypothetical protein